MLLIEIDRAALPAARVSQLAPAADLVGGAAIELGIHKALDQRHRMAPGALPIRTQATQHEPHEPADQVGIMAVGQHTQTRVVDHQRQPLAPQLLGPTNKPITRFEVEGGGAPSGHGQPSAFPNDGVAQLLAHQLRAVQVMVIEENLIAFLDVPGLHQQLDGHPQQNSLFIRRGPAKRRFALLHLQRIKNFFPDVPQKVLNR